MAGVVLETLSNKKLLILSISLVLILAVFFLVGGIVAPAPNSVINSIAIKCIDYENVWQLNHVKPFIPRGEGQCPEIRSFDEEKDLIEAEHIDAQQIVFSQSLPLPRNNIELDMSRWFQSLISLLDVNIQYSKDNQYPDKEKPEMVLEAKLYYRNKEDGKTEWKLLAASTEKRTLDCTIDPEKKVAGNLYHCELLPFFELGSVHHDYYLINLRLPPIYEKKETNKVGEIVDIHVIAIFQNGGLTQVWFSMKTILFPMVLAVLVWFWRRVTTQGRSPNLTERTIFALGIILSIKNCPIEWLTLAVDMTFMMLLNDMRDGAFYAILLSFWLIFVGEHMIDQEEKNRLKAYWKHLTIIILACLAFVIFKMWERGIYLVNPFSSIWSSEIGGAAAFGFIITAGIAACFYFFFLCYLVFKQFRTINSKNRSLLYMSSLKRTFCSGLIFRSNFFMVLTLLCAALSVIFFIIGQLREAQWKWGDIAISLENTSAFLTGVYGMWNVYVIAILILYAPSHEQFPMEIGTDEVYFIS